MRHRMRSRRLSRTTSARRALLAGMAKSLIEHEQITTTLARAKTLRGYAERLVTLGKRGGLHRRRQLYARLNDDAAVRKIFDVLAPRYTDRQGGYTRVLKAGFRRGDDAPMAVIELVGRDESAKGARDRAQRAALEAAAS